MAKVKEVRESAEKARLAEWWAVPKSSHVVGYRVPIDVHHVSKTGSTNTTTILLPEELVGRVVAWSAVMTTRRGLDWVPFETLGSQLSTIRSEDSGTRSQELRVLWRANPDAADPAPERDGLACSLLLTVR